MDGFLLEYEILGSLSMDRITYAPNKAEASFISNLNHFFFLTRHDVLHTLLI